MSRTNINKISWNLRSGFYLLPILLISAKSTPFQLDFFSDNWEFEAESNRIVRALNLGLSF